jgi:hypothetical protein
MSKVRFQISVSLDGYVAGPDQSVENPLGVGGEDLHQWVIELEAWRRQHGLEGGEVNASTPVVVLTRHPREPLEMRGGTTFFFVTDGIGPALEQARRAAGDRDVLLGGRASVVQQYLAAGLVRARDGRRHVARRQGTWSARGA